MQRKALLDLGVRRKQDVDDRNRDEEERHERAGEGP
jgi:hypothetical protein